MRLPTWLLVCCSVMAGQTLRVSVKPVPTGAMAQIRLELERPVPLATGRFRVELPEEVFGPIEDVQVFSAVGDAVGTVTLRSNLAEVWFRSSSAGVGRVNGMPVATVLAPLKARQERAWAKVTITEEWKPATTEPWTPEVVLEPMGELGPVTVSSVVPLSETTYRVTGTGFTAGTAVEVGGTTVTGVTFRSGTELEFTVAGPGELTGRIMLVGGAEWVYALETVTAKGTGTRRVLVPLRGQSTANLGEVQAPARLRYGLTLVNPHPEPVAMTLEVLDVTTRLVERRTELLPARGRWELENSSDLLVPFRAQVGLVFSRPVRVATTRLELGLPETYVNEVSAYAAIGPPEVAVSPTSLELQSTVGGRADEGLIGANLIRSLAPVAFQVVSNVPWLLVTGQSTGAGARAVARPADGLTPGDYRGSVQVMIGGTSLPPVVIPVKLTVRPAAYFELPPEVTAATTVEQPRVAGAIYYQRAPGSSAPLSLRVEVDGGWRWLTATSSTDASAGAVLLAVDSTGLAPGTYIARVTATGAVNAQTVVVRLTVTKNEPPWFVSPSTLEFAMRQGHSTTLTARVGIAPIEQRLGVQVKESEAWLAAGPSATDPTSLTVRVNGGGLPAGSYRGVLVVGDGPREATVTVRLRVWAGETGDLTVRVTPPPDEFSREFWLRGIRRRWGVS